MKKTANHISQRETIDDILEVKTLAVLQSVTGGSCALVDPDDGLISPTPITAFVELATDDARLLTGLLLDVKSWFFASKRCLPRATAVIDLNSHAGDAKLMIGMPCEGWDLRVGHDRAGGFFDPVANQVRGILKRTFPEIASTGARSMWKAGAIAKLKQDALARQDVAEP